MTTPWSINPDFFSGATVAVICAGADQDVLERVSRYRKIAVRRAFEVVPDADILVAIDGPTGSLDDDFWRDAEDFDGIKVCGVECAVDAKYIGIYYERIVLGPAHIVEVRNNGLFAIRVAAMGGAAKILLVGFDPERYERIHGVAWMAQGLEQITAELRAKGIEIERVDSAQAAETVTTWPVESKEPIHHPKYPPKGRDGFR